MKRLFTVMIAIAAVWCSGMAQKRVLLNEDFESVPVVYEDHYAPISMDGWTTTTDNPADMPQQWCVYASDKKDTPNNVGLCDCNITAPVYPRQNVLYTPVLNLDGNFELSFLWKASPLALDKGNFYDFKVYVVEDGKTLADGTLVFDYLNADMLLESGVQKTSWGALWEGWKWYKSTINLKDYKDKKVKVAFEYRANSPRANSIFLDNVKVVETDVIETPILSLSTNRWNFGDVYVGSKVYSDIITITNTGVNGLKIDEIVAPDGVSLRASSDPLTTVLKKNETMQVMLGYSAALTTPVSGELIFKGNFPDAKISYTANKKAVPANGVFEGFEGEVFPPAGWATLNWRASSAGIEGDKAAAPYGYYGQKCWLRSPRVDASKTAATIEFSYADFYSGEELSGADTTVKLKFSQDGGETWELVDTFDYNDTYNEILRKSYSRKADSTNCYWQFDWSLDYYDPETGANASSFYLDAVMLTNLYGSGEKPEAVTKVTPSNGSTEVFNRGLTLSWQPVQFADGYKLRVAAGDEVVVDDADLGNVLSYALPALKYETLYKWTVTAYNRFGNVPSETFEFTTISDPTVSQYPYSEGFDEAFPPKGWNITGEGDTKWKQNDISPFDGKASAMANPRSNGKSCILETPDFVIPADATVQATFFWGDDVAVNLQKHPSGVSENTTKASDGISDLAFEVYVDGAWVRKALLSDKENPYWIRERIDLSEYAGKTIAMRWVYTYYNYTHAWGACVDNFNVEILNGDKISFNVSGWDAGKVNFNEQFTTPAEFTLINDGAAEVEVSDVAFTNAELSTDLKVGTKLAPGTGTVFTISVNGATPAKTIADALVVTTKSGAKASLPVAAEILAEDVHFYGFERQANGDLEVPGLIFVDVDRKNPVQLGFVDYVHKGDKMAFMVINYTQNDWPNPYPRTGKQCLVAFGTPETYGGAEEEWLIKSNLEATITSAFTFCGRNYEGVDRIDGQQMFGPGKAAVLVSEDADPLKREAYKLVAEYTLPYPEKEEYAVFTTDLGKYAGKKVHVALRHCSENGLAYLYDDLSYDHFTTANDTHVAGVKLEGVRLAQNPVTDLVEVVGTDVRDLTVIAMDGAVVARGSGQTLDVSALPAGLYLLHINAEAGTMTMRIVKK